MGGKAALPADVREAMAAAIYKAVPRIQAPESLPPKWEDCSPRYRLYWFRCADAAIGAADGHGWKLAPKAAE